MNSITSNQQKPFDILVVDDTPANLKLLAELLSVQGYHVRPASSGKLALRSIKAAKPDLILLDVKMTGIDGYEVCKQLKADECTADIPVVFISAFDDEPSKVKGFEVGGVDFISKPFRKEEVLARVKTHVELYRLQRELKTRNQLLEGEVLMRKRAEAALEKRMFAITQPLENDAKYEFDELFNLNQIQKLQDQFAAAFGVASIITKPNGTPITQPSNFTRLCQNIIRCTDKGLKNCMHSDAVIGRHNPDAPVVQPCLSGSLWDAGASITIGGYHVANWMIGQVRDEVQQEAKLKEYAHEIGANEHDFMEAFNEIPSMSQAQFHKIADVLFTMAGQLSDMAYQNMQQAHFISDKKIAESALQESEESFRTTLYSIGDGVITTDKKGRVQLMNTIAEQLTGFSQTDASGKMLEEVFQIINEETLEPVELPIRKVLREGLVVGLANHTVLIAKDGTQRPIADSGAPIKNAQGEITGVVLVFQDQTEERKAEQAMRESEYFFRESQKAANIGSFKYDFVKGIWNSSEVLDQLLGLEKKENRTFNEWVDLIHPEDREMMIHYFAEEVVEKRLSFDKEYRVIRKSDGKTHYVLGQAKQFYNEHNQLIAVIGTIQDISERKRTEDVIKQNEAKFRGLFENATVGFSMTQPGGEVNINHAFANMLGYETEELKQISWKEITHPDDIQESIKVIELLKSGKESQHRYDKRYIHKNGTVVWADVSTTLMRNQNGEPLYFITNINNLTERKEAEAKLQKSENRFRKLVENGYDMITLVDGSGHMIYSSPSIENVLGNRVETLIGNYFTDLVHPDDQETLIHSFAKLMQSSEHIHFEPIRVLHSSGIWHWVEGSANNLLADPDVNAIVVNYRDITIRKQIEENIKKERTLLRTLIDHLPNTVYVKDLEGRKLIANKADIEFIGKSFKEVLKKTDIELFEGEIGQHGFTDDMRVMQTGESMLNIEENFIDNKGVKRWLVTSKIPLRDSAGKVYGLVGTGRDITNQHNDHETIQKLTKSIEQSPSTIVITDTQGAIQYVNPKSSEITGYTTEEALGKNPRILKSGELSTEKYNELWDIIKTGGVWRGEFHNRKKNGELYWEWATITSIKDDQGQIINYIAIKEDISLRKQLETDLIAAKEKAEENDRLKSAFLANMSHEIRTPLNCILGFTELITDPDAETEERLEYSKLIVNSGNNLLSIINDILDISRIESGQVHIKKSKFPVQRIIKEVVNLFENKANEQGVLLRIAPDLIKKDIMIESDDAKLKQVLINFVSNALKFTEIGSIEIGVKIGGDTLQLYVRDTGIGISKKFHVNIFERFRQVETSHTRKYGGNGLGLAISKSLIELLGGTIGMESEVGKGSLFYVKMPVKQFNFNL